MKKLFTLKWIFVGFFSVLIVYAGYSSWQQHQPVDQSSGQSHQSSLLNPLDDFWNLHSSTFFTGSWTNWYTKPMQQGLIQLGIMRHELFHNNLYDTYLDQKQISCESATNGYLRPDGSCLDDPSKIDCTGPNQIYRSADGTCNNLEDKIMGAAGMRMGRNINPNSLTPEQDETLLNPNPALVSSELLTRENGKMKPVTFLNLLAASWIQFMIHDWFNHIPERPNGNNTITIPLPSGHPITKNKGGAKSFQVVRTPLDTGSSPLNAENKPLKVFINENTHWWDGSQLYGSSQAVQDKVRSHQDGKLKVIKTTLGDGKIIETLPLDNYDDTESMFDHKKEITGFNRNWWVGLSLFHTLFALEHNHIVDLLKKQPESNNWDDERLFQTARLINVAIMAKIHTIEWTPAILQNSTLREAMKGNWYGLSNHSPEVNARYKALFEIPPFGPALRPILGGLVGGEPNLYDVPYSLTEEFNSVYRLHSLLPDSIPLFTLDGKAPAGQSSLLLEDTREEKAKGIIKKYGMSDLLYTFGNNHPGQITTNNFPSTLQNVDIPFHGQIDIGAIDIFRDRERGVPRYNAFRLGLGLKRVNSFEDLTDNNIEVIQKLKKVYGNDAGAIDRLDLLIGTLAEAKRPTGFGFGETQFQIFILMASRRLLADRFFTTDYNASVYSQFGLDYIDKASLKSVITDSFPELAEHIPDNDDTTGLSGFSPWSTDSKYKGASPVDQ